jgi:O-antigen ligase
MTKNIRTDSLFLESRVGQIISYTGILTTLVVNPWTNYDPISLPKMAALIAGSFAAGTIFFANRSQFFDRFSRIEKIILSVFPLSLFIPFLFSGADLAQQFWGVFGRNTGLISYLALALLMIATASLQRVEVYERIIYFFILSSIPLTAYCLVQFFNLDPIPWSEHFVFGTLGNVNFLSAFLAMTSLATVSYGLLANLKISSRLVLFSYAGLKMFLASSTDSIQGPVIFAIGIALLPVFLILTKKRGKKFNFSFLLPYFLILLLGFVALVFGLFNRGPLARVIFQPSVTFRGDYMHAGWEMLLRRPFTGVGMDSYGDWYRELRGEISTLRTGPNRTANTAHNIFLDLASNGGLVVALTYAGLLLLVIIAIFKLIRTGRIQSPFVVLSIVVWVAYQVQALVSINQLGVGVWGWIFSGIVLGFAKTQDLEKLNTARNFKNSKELKKKYRGKPLPPMQLLISVAGLLLGIAMAVPPVAADAGYRSAQSTGSFEKIYAATNRLGSTQQHRELLLDLTMRNNLASETGLVARELVARYPRNSFGWRVLSVAVAATAEERSQARQVAISLDPFNPEPRSMP